MENKIDNQLYELQKACNRYLNTDCLANWVLYAVDRYIFTDRVTMQFLKDFISISPEKFESIIANCLNGNRSDDDIIKRFKIQISKNGGNKKMNNSFQINASYLHNGNMIFKIHFDSNTDSSVIGRDDIFDSFISVAYDNDCEIWGDEFCISQSEMGMCLYSWDSDMKYIIPFSALDILIEEGELELVGVRLDESERKCWKNEFQ